MTARRALDAVRRRDADRAIDGKTSGACVILAGRVGTTPGRWREHVQAGSGTFETVCNGVNGRYPGDVVDEQLCEV